MQFYLDLIAGDKTLQDLSDEQLQTLVKQWMDGEYVLHPTGPIWDAAGKEQRQREIDRAWKPKPIDRGFYS